MTTRARRAAVAVVLLACLLRVAGLGGRSFWLDEAFSAWHAARSPAAIWQETHDVHPPLYYLMLHGWLALGRQEAILRLPSAYASLVGISLLHALGRRLFGRPAALAAAGLLAVAPPDVWYAQEARMALFVVPPGMLMALGLHRGGRRGALLLFAGLALGLYLDYPAGLLWLALSAAWLADWWRAGRPGRPLRLWLAASAIGWLAAAPLWPHLLAVVRQVGDFYYFARPGGADLGAVTTFVAVAAAALALALAVFIGALAIPRWLRHPRAGPLLAIAAAAAFALLTALAPVPRLYGLKRAAVVFWPFITLAVVWLVSRGLRRPRPAFAVLALVSLIATLALTTVPKDDWRAVVAFLNAHAAAGDVVWLDPFSGSLPYGYYRPRVAPQFSADLLPAPPATAIWHVAERQPGKPVPASRAEAWLDASRPLQDAVPFYRLELRRYGPPPS